MRTSQVVILADVVWPDGVMLPEQEMRDLCAEVALGIAGHLEFGGGELANGRVTVGWGAPIAPENLEAELRREEQERMTGTTETETPEVSEEQAKIIERPEGATTEAQPMTERDVPPAKSWGVYVYNAQAVAPEPACHIYGYDAAGNPLTEADATELAALLSVGHSGTIMALPNEEAPAIAPSADPLEQPHDEQHDQA